MDLDGTTVDARGRLSDKNKQAFKEAKAAGHLICFVSGRRDSDMVSIIDECGDVDYLILNNGGKLICNQTHRVLENDMMDPVDTAVLIAFCLENKYQIHVLSGLKWYINKWSQGLQSYVESLGYAPEYFSDLEQLPMDQIEGLTATGDSRDICEFIRARHLRFTVVASEPDCVDIMSKGVNKWSGIEKLLPIVGLGREDVIAAGDYENDIEMIVNAGTGVAVANALDCVKEQADYITVHDNSHSAMADMIHELVLGKEKGLCMKREANAKTIL